MTATKYATTLDVINYLGTTKQVPDYSLGSTSTESLSGSTATGYVLAHNNPIYGTETIVGATATLVKTTDYTIDYDAALITLTSSGVVKVGGSTPTASYKYNLFYKESVVSDTVDSMTEYIDTLLMKTYQPYQVAFREEQPGKGAYVRLYNARNPNVKIWKNYLTAQIDAATATIPVHDTTGLSAGDFVTIESEVMKVVSVDTPTQFTATRATTELGGTSAAVHAIGVYMTNVVLEISNSPIGYTPLWHTLQFLYNFDVDSDTGGVQLLHVNAEDKDALASDLYPPQRIFNRVKMTYKYGEASVPSSIKRLCILLSSRELYGSMVNNALTRGTDGFSSEGMVMIDKEIDRIVKQNKRLMMDGF